MEGIVATLVPISLFVVLGAVVGVIVYFTYRGREDLQITVRTSIEKGQEGLTMCAKS